MPENNSIQNSDNDNHNHPGDNIFPIVGLGASAGGLEALKSFFSELPEKSGMAFIVVMHLKPGQPSMMPDIIQKTTRTPVTAAEDGQAVEPDHIYVVPPGKDINVYDGCIQLMDQIKQTVPHPVDHFLRSLAIDRGSKSAGVILSGTGSDGTLGVKEIKARDGLVLAQSLESAGYDGMPGSAAGTGIVDLVLPPEEMPNVLIQYFSRMGDKKAMEPEKVSNQQDWLNKIFAILRTRVGHDFSCYKSSTILRRIDRRMGLNHISSHEAYVRFMRENSAEVDALFREFLIGVTTFFREEESFEALKKNILPDCFNKLSKEETFRVWVPGCSTGEEVYSLAMVLRECLDDISGQAGLQIFGTDIDNDAIEKARLGVFPSSISAHVSEDRLKRFFKEEEGFFRINKEIRDCAVFSTQNIIKDPPFPRIHLLCCRNLLIYLNAKAQKKVLPVFHYTLNPGGILMLGSSETIGSFSNLFKPLDGKCKIFMKKEVPRALRQIVDFPSGTPSVKGIPAHIPAAPGAARYSDIGELTRKAVLEQFAPTAVLIDGQGEVLHVQGRTGKYLETPSGPPTNNILDLCRKGLRTHLSSALRDAKTSGTRQTRRRLTVKTNGDIQMMNLHVCPQSDSTGLAGRFLAAFEKVTDDTRPQPPETEARSGEESPAESTRIEELEKELRITRESHQATIEELESSNEELKSTNEEVQSANEELQSTNEELESSKEELQSLNEELQTVNSELQSKVAELSSAHDDMQNLLESTEIATIFVDKNMCVRRFTPQATEIVNLIATDIGRPLKHVVSNLEYEHMIRDLEEVHKKLVPKEKEVRTDEGKWYNMRIMPYRTTDNRIDGLVVTFSGIHEQITQQQRLRQAKIEAETTRELLKLVFDMNQDPMVVLDHDGNIVIANTALFRLIDFASESAPQKNPVRFPADIFPNAELGERLKNAYENGTDFTTGPAELKTGRGGKQIAIHGRCIENSADSPYRILLRFMESQPEEGPT